MKQAQPLGQKMDQARARLRPAVESGEKAMEALQKAQETFEQAQQEVVQAQMDPDELIQEAPLPVKPAPQVNVSLVKILEALTGLIENMWNPEAGATTRSPDTGNAGVILQTSSVLLSQKGGAALVAEQDPDLWNLDEDEAEQMASFEEAHASGGPRAESTRARKATAQPTQMTPPPKKTITRAGQEGAQVQRLSARAMQNPRDTELLALSQRLASS